MTFERAAHLLTPLGDERASKLVHNADTAPFGMAAAIMMRTLSRAGALADDAKSVRQAWNSANVDLMALISDTAVRQQEEVRHTHTHHCGLLMYLTLVFLNVYIVGKCGWSWQTATAQHCARIIASSRRCFVGTGIVRARPHCRTTRLYYRAVVANLVGRFVTDAILVSI